MSKAARRGGRQAAPSRAPITADAISALLAGAPRLVDYLLEEDSIRR